MAQEGRVGHVADHDDVLPCKRRALRHGPCSPHSPRLPRLLPLPLSSLGSCPPAHPASVPRWRVRAFSLAGDPGAGGGGEPLSANGAAWLSARILLKIVPIFLAEKEFIFSKMFFLSSDGWGDVAAGPAETGAGGRPPVGSGEGAALSLSPSVNCLQGFNVGEAIKKKIRNNRKCGCPRNRPLLPPSPRGLAPEHGKSALGWPRLTPGMWPQPKRGTGRSSHRQGEHSSARSGTQASPLHACGHRVPLGPGEGALGGRNRLGSESVPSAARGARGGPTFHSPGLQASRAGLEETRAWQRHSVSKQLGFLGVPGNTAPPACGPAGEQGSVGSGHGTQPSLV